MKSSATRRDIRHDEQGAALVFVAISMVAMLIVAALIIDGGFGYTNRRQMQNASDTASLAGARALQLARFGGGSVGTIATAASAAASRNGSSGTVGSLYQCGMLTLAQSRLDPQPDVTTLVPCTSVSNVPLDPNNVNNFVGVVVRAGETHATLLARVAGQNSQTTRALSAASVQKALGPAGGPWTMCGNAALGGYNFLDPLSGTPPTAMRNDATLIAEYGANGTLLIDPDGSGPLPKSFPVHGKVDDGAPPSVVDTHCGASGKGLSSNWKGLIEPDDVPVSLANPNIDVDNGKKVGQYHYEDTLAGQSGCPDSVNNIDKGSDDFGPAFDNCLVAVPIFNDVLGGDRVHIVQFVVLRLFYRQTGTVKYYGQFVCSSTCDTLGIPTTDDITGGGLGAVKLLR